MSHSVSTLCPVTDSTTLPQLPTEIWERSLDQLDALIWGDHDNRRWTFSACCLVCRAWLPRSRYHLFQWVLVRSKDHVKEVSRLLRSIPALRTRVWELAVYGSRNGKEDASWIGLVGFHLGPKLKALRKIEIQNVNFSFMKLQSFQFWGAFNRAWRPGATRELELKDCTVTHLDQLVRLALVTKSEELDCMGQKSHQADRLPVPILPPSVSLPLLKFSLTLYSNSSDLVSSAPWHILARQCPSLSSVNITCWRENLDFSSLDTRRFLVSIFDMFRCMQRHNDTNDLALRVTSWPTIEIRTRPYDQSDDASSTPPPARPRLHRELVLFQQSLGELDPMSQFTQVLTCFEDTMAQGVNSANRGLHRVKITHPFIYDPRPDLCQPLDALLSLLHVTAPDVQITVRGDGRSRNGCIFEWARERFPTFTQLIPTAFCHVEAGRPCESHPKQGERGKETGVEEGMAETSEKVG